MPTYDYECDACGHTFDVFQKMSDEHLKKCPECNKKKLRRLIGAGAAVVFKGSGFYETDYRSDSYKKGAAAEKKAAESKTDTKSDTKSKDSTTKSSDSSSASSDSSSSSSTAKKKSSD